VAIDWFAEGLLVSDALFATATFDEARPIVDGLALDEALLGGPIVEVVVVCVTRFVKRRRPGRRAHGVRPAPPRPRSRPSGIIARPRAARPADPPRRPQHR
jgi:hypothetical protein